MIHNGIFQRLMHHFILIPQSRRATKAECSCQEQGLVLSNSNPNTVPGGTSEPFDRPFSGITRAQLQTWFRQSWSIPHAVNTLIILLLHVCLLGGFEFPTTNSKSLGKQEFNAEDKGPDQFIHQALSAV